MASISKENYNPEEYLLDTLDSLDIGFVKVSNDDTILNNNLTFNKILGYNPKKNLISTKILDYWLNPEERNKFREDLFKNGIVKKYGVPVKKVDGEKIFLQLNFKLNKNSNGEIISSEGTFVDVTERIRTEQKLKESEEKYKTILDGIVNGVWVTDKDDIIYYTNKGMEKIAGIPSEQIVNVRVLIDFPESTLKYFRPYYLEAKNTLKSVFYDEVPVETPASRQSFQSGWLIPIEKEGKYDGIICTVEDVTERKKAEEKLKESEKKLRDLNQKLEKKVEERTKKLKESEEKYRLITENANDLIAVLDDKLRYKYVNNGYELLGYSKEEIYNSQATDLLHPDDVKKAIKAFRKGLKYGTGLEELRVKHKDGKFFWFEVKGKTFRDLNGETNALLISRDITERKKIEQKLKESEKKYRMLIENALEGIWVIDENSITSFVNPRMAEMLGYSKDEMLGKELFDFMDERGISIAKRNVERRKQGIKEQHDFEFLRKNGTRIYASLETSPITDEEGNYRGAIAFVADITERKKAERKLKESEKKYRNIIENTIDGIIIIGLDGKFKFISPQLSNILGGREITLDTEWFSNVHPDDMDNLVGFFSKVVKKKDILTTEEVEFRALHNDGHYIWLSSSSKNYYDEDGNMIGFITLLRDITERKEKQKEIFDLAQFPSENPYPILRVNKNGVMYINEAGQKLLNIVDYSQIPKIFQERVKNTFESNQISESEVEFDNRVYSFTITPVKDANYVNIYGMDITERKHVEENLKEVNKLKSEFLRRASHELKTPLISIKGFSDLILSLYADQLDLVIISKIREIHDGCERLQNIINNLLKSSRLESPELKPKLQKEDLSFLIKYCVHELESLAEKRNQSIKLDIHNELYANIEKEEIHDVLSNLLTNAIKYTPPMGKIEIKTELNEDSVVVSVNDNGIGFTEGQKTKIFQQFGKIERYGQGLDLGIDGTGLGLYISKRIVELHGGKIWMESEGKNKGSSFYFTLPTVK